MTGERWRSAYELFHAACDLPAEERSEFVSGLPSGTRDLVESMLEDLETDDAMEATAENARPGTGKIIGRFSIESPIGHGGMGIVYRAIDTDLHRPVALKFLRSAGSGPAPAIESFLREAQAISALNHPNVVTVHEVIRSDSNTAIIMELVEGASFRRMIGQAASIEAVARWGAQIAQGLAAAHARGIIHRDIKPENLMLRSDGLIKILDFGLARTIGSDAPVEQQPIGTIGYMSPEQLRGDPLTAASDVFSLGVVLIELATGKHPFLEGTPTSTALAIGEREIEIQVPPIARGKEFARLLRSMLEKDPAQRPASAAVASRLERIATRKRFGAARWIAAAAALVAAAVWLRTVSLHEAVHLSTPAAITSYDGIEHEPSISPDGSRFLFVWSGADSDHDEVYMRTIAGDDLRRITNDSRPKYGPVWSPDGRSIAWQSRARDGSGTLIMVAPVNGPARLAGSIADHEGFYGIEFWPDSGSIVANDLASWGRSLVRLNLADGSKTFLTTEPGVNDELPVFSPDHKRLLFLRNRANFTRLCVLDLASHTRESCYDAGGDVQAAAWLGDSHSVLYADPQALWQMNLAGSAPHPVRVAEGEFRNLRNSPDGRRFVFNRSLVDLNIWRLDTATGQETRFQESSAEDSEPQFSPDGREALFRSKRTGAFELYLCAPDGTGTRQITSLHGDLGSATWSPDGKWIAFDTTHDASGRTRYTNIAVIPSEGGPVRRITPDDAEYTVPGWSADGRFLYCGRGDGRQVVRIPLAGGPPAAVFDHEMFDVRERPAGRFLFAIRERGDGIWTRGPDGAESIVRGTENSLYRTWDVRGSNIYFLGEGPAGKFTELSLDGKGLRKLPGARPRRVFHGPRNLTASPDGSAILYTSEDLAVGDIFLMEVRRL